LLQTKIEEIVDAKAIGSTTNPINLNALLGKAGKEILRPTSQDTKRALLLCIDMQNDFMEGGSLAVPKSHGDVERLTKWIYGNMENISKIAFSIDTHNPFQIFHPCWWVDDQGKNPPPFTVISIQDLNAGKWKAIINPLWSREYVENLEKQGNYKLCIWPFHCIQGTFGQSLENQLSNMIYFHSVAKKSIARQMIKGNNPLTEMYGILKAEYDPLNKVNIEFLNDLKKYSVIVIAGEAKSHCVRRSIEQILDHFKNDLDITKNIYILEDCMSSIPSFEADTDTAFNGYKAKHKVNIVKSDTFKLKDVM
jgi:nicotinamidase-related amidase